MKPRHNFSQIDDDVQEAFSWLCLRHPLAAATLHALIKLADKKNCVVISTAALARRFGYHERSQRRAIKTLIDDAWIARLQLGTTKSVGAYVLNDLVCWKDDRAKRGRLVMLEAMLAIAPEEQPEGALEPRRLRDTRKLMLPSRIPTVDGQPVQLSFDGFDDE